MSTAWTKGIADAPRDRMILLRTQSWGDVPAVVEWCGDHGGYWSFSEATLADIVGEVAAEDLEQCEWAEVPR